MKTFLAIILSSLGCCLAQDTPIITTAGLSEEILRNLPERGNDSPTARALRPILEKHLGHEGFDINFAGKLKYPIIEKRFPRCEFHTASILFGVHGDTEDRSLAMVDFVICSKGDKHMVSRTGIQANEFLKYLKGNKIESEEDAVEIAQAIAIIFRTLRRELIETKHIGSDFVVVMGMKNLPKESKYTLTFTTDADSKCVDFKVQHTPK